MLRYAGVLGLAVAACGGSTADPVPAGGSSTADTVAVPACSWPTVAGWGADRGYLTCTDHAGGGLLCPTDDLKNCKTAGSMVSGGPWTCHDQCEPTEYSLSCGGIGPSAAPSGNPPSACRFAGAVPAGIAFYCCPCGS